MPAKVLIAGASGVVGAAMLERLLERTDAEVVALSRRVPDVDAARPFTHLAVDLRDRDATAAALGGLGITHVLYTALFEKPGLIPGWAEQDQMDTNLAMLTHTLAPLVAGGTLAHVTTLQGTKAYANHLKPMPIPARETLPRDSHANFYWLQEDHLMAQAEAHGFTWSVLRPQLIVGGAIGVAMNLAPIIGVYAAICRELGEPFSFPGGPSFVWEAVDSRLVAAAAEFTLFDPAAAGQRYNVTNGDVFEWRNLWPALAEQTGVEVGPDRPRSMAAFIPEHAAAWDAVVGREGLVPHTLEALLGESHHYADFCFAYGRDEPFEPMFVSAIKLRQAGVTDAYDTTDTFRHWIGWLQARRILPPARP